MSSSMLYLEQNMSPESRPMLSRYVDRGWFNAAGDERLRYDTSYSPRLRPAYLVLASGMQVRPSCEIQITARCNYRSFRGRQLVVATDAARRFDLIDLKIMHQSQFRRDEPLPLNACIDEVSPELIRWPLECKAGGEFEVRAIIPTAELGGGEVEDLGAVFEMILLGVVF